ncbi:MAG TPA: L-2-hydroxyglutarate oxidase [Candidatus Limnocylindrales bacterium]|nr:L-2-hydroxyglutarate oxidase [Candidatus Limnocylindrales bacterium]
MTDPGSALIVGGGIVGLATALRFSERFPSSPITLLEKEPRVGAHQTGHNSGVLHCGLYYKPGSVKARLAVQGIRQMVEFCLENGVPHDVCGKLVVAAGDSEVQRLRDLHERGIANGLEGLRWLSRPEMLEIEPHVGGVAALRVPQEGIVDYLRVCDVLVEKLQSRGVRVITGARVTRLRQTSSAWTAESTAGAVEGRFLITCAGLHADRVAASAGEPRDIRIVPFRGEYFKLKPESAHLVRNLIYPVPDPRFPFLGVHFTRLIHGGVEAGPNAVLAFAREGYRKTDFNAADLFDALTYRGFWRFLRKYPSMAWFELRRSFSKEIFCQSLRRLVPEIQPSDLATGGSGVRAQALSPAGDIIQDFQLIARRNALHVLNAPSPAATASLAIGQEIVEMIARN